MLTNRIKKLIKSLQINKYRHLEQRFLVEGTKNVLELLGSDWEVDLLLYTPDLLNHLKDLSIPGRFEGVQVKPAELAALGTMKNNNGALAVAKMKAEKVFNWTGENYIIGLETIQDPGNFGTILRIADWYGIREVVCSKDSVDFYNPKVVNASMGSFMRVIVYQEYLKELIESTGMPVYGFTLHGQSLHKFKFHKQGMLVFGNESRGLSAPLKESVTEELTIPKRGSAESLNVGVSVAIALDNLVRN